MMKKLLTMAAGVMMAATVTAQGQFPTEYVGFMGSSGFSYDVVGVWDEIVQGKPGQGLGLVGPGVKTLTTKIDAEGFELPDVIYDFYPNGLVKAVRQEGGVNPQSNKKWTYHYNKQWQLMNVVSADGKVVYKYNYDDKGRLVKCIYANYNSEETDYKYDEQGKLTQIVKDGRIVMDYNKDGQMLKLSYAGDESSEPLTNKYDAQGRWKGYTQIVLDGMDEEFYTKLDLTLNYTTGSLPTSMILRTGECDPRTKAYKGTPETYTGRCTYQYDSHKNWTMWKQAGGSPSWTLNRTILYYTDEEVKQAVEQMETARKPAREEKKQEDLWEF